MSKVFMDFLKEVKSIRFKEPLAGMLGAFREEDAVLDYTFIETVKMAGHACPTVAGAYLVCREALEKLYPDSVPVRGEIEVTVYGEQDEGVYGVMGQVFSFLTGAAPATGFKGLGYRFKRKDLLKFNPKRVDPAAMCFGFKRMDNGESVLAKFYPRKVPSTKDVGELMEKVLWDAAKPHEKKEFQDIWMDKVKTMVLDRKEIDKWLVVEGACPERA